jgi:predicted RNase H-like HicB family nuclease
MTLDEYVNQPFRVIVQREPTTKGGWTYVARNPQVQGLRAQGSSPARAKAALREARQLLFGLMLKRGVTPPLVSARQATAVGLAPQPMRVASFGRDNGSPHIGTGTVGSLGLRLDDVALEVTAAT